MPDRSLGQWLSYLERLHPSEIELGLIRVGRVATRLSLSPVSVPVITIAGTNGKGSVAYSCDAVLHAHGLRVGRYTSPHILAFNERITVNGEAVGDDEIVAAFVAIEAARRDISLTYFEFATLAALYCFRARRVEVMVLEVGLGGRLDAVNLVDAPLAVITAIDLDHQAWLGDTRELIGREKAGIARRGQQVVLAEREYPASVRETLLEAGALPLSAGRDWDWTALDGDRLGLHLADPGAPALELALPPGLRAANVAAAVKVASLLLGDRLQADRVRRGLAAVVVPGRRQRCAYRGRELVFDVAHNGAAIRALAAWLRAHPVAGRSYAAIGAMADKDIAAMATALATAVDGAWALALPGVARAEAPERVWQILDSVGIAVQQSDFTAAEVLEQLLAGSSPGDRIVFCGSFHTVAVIMSALGVHSPSAPEPVLDFPE
jgi:dihydrofolate synthase/folylpolyglutamate synthase